MKSDKLSWAVTFLVAMLPLYGFALPLAAPSFMWSPCQTKTKATVNYQTLSPKSMAELVVSGGGWGDMVYSEKPLDLAVVFVGKEVSLSSTGPHRMNSDVSDLIKIRFSSSNFSMGFPYVTAPEDDETTESSLFSAFEGSGTLSKVAIMSSCHLGSKSSKKLTGLASVLDYVSEITKKSEIQADTLFICHDENHAESEMIQALISYMDQLRLKYSFLYVSDARVLSNYALGSDLRRILMGNESSNSTCNGVCQMKSSLLEGLLVGIVLLIILITGLCCMAGIDTPTRFEANHES